MITLLSSPSPPPEKRDGMKTTKTLLQQSTESICLKVIIKKLEDKADRVDRVDTWQRYEKIGKLYLNCLLC